jgi:hypothetical protein
VGNEIILHDQGIIASLVLPGCATTIAGLSIDIPDEDEAEGETDDAAADAHGG